MIDIHRFASEHDWAPSAARALSLDIVRALADAETALVAAAGGGTPGAILPLLKLEDPLWKRVTVVPTDERLAPPGDAARNDLRLAGWMQAAAAHGARIMSLEDVDPARAPDAVLLGFGADRHIASLFPAGDGMAAAAAPETKAIRARVTPEPLPPEAPFQRLTFTMRALTAPRRVVLAASGADKSKALSAALAESPPRTPLALLLAQQRAAVTVFLCEPETRTSPG